MNIGYHNDLIREALLLEGFPQDHPFIRAAKLANGCTDIFQQKMAAKLIEQIFSDAVRPLVLKMHHDRLPDRRCIEMYTDFLIAGTHRAVAGILESGNTGTGSVVELALALGTSVHIVQDFYSHANWVEMDPGRLAGVEDMTWFEADGTLDQAIAQNLAARMSRFGNASEFLADDDLYTHCGQRFVPCRPAHSDQDHEKAHQRGMNKDHPGRAYFEWAYRAAFRATLQWVRLVRKWAGEDLWTRARNWSGEHLDQVEPGLSLEQLDKYARDDGGHLWRVFEAVGAFKGFESSRDDWALITQLFVFPHGIPPLGQRWKAVAETVGTWLFTCPDAQDHETSEPYAQRLKLKKQEYERTLAGLQEEHGAAIQDAKAFLRTSAPEKFRWLRIRIPRCVSHDPHDDLYAKTRINGLLYREAEYLNNLNPRPSWVVLKPLKGSLPSPVQVSVELWEDDTTKFQQLQFVPTEHHGPLEFQFDPKTGTVTVAPNMVPQERIRPTRSGWRLHAVASNGMQAWVEIGLASNRRIECVVKTPDNVPDPNDAPVLDVGPQTFLLRNLASEVVKQGCTETFVFDPGTRSIDPVRRLGIRRPRDSSTWYPARFSVRVAARVVHEPSGSPLQPGPLAWFSGIGLGNPGVRPSDLNQPVKFLTVSVQCPPGGMVPSLQPVFFAILREDGSNLCEWPLDTDSRQWAPGDPPFVQGTTTTFHLEPPKPILVSEIAKGRLSLAGGGEWTIGPMEVWVNDRLLASVEGGVVRNHEPLDLPVSTN